MSYLERLEMIDYIVAEVDRETQGDFEFELLMDQLESWTDLEVRCEAENYGWL